MQDNRYHSQAKSDRPKTDGRALAAPPAHCVAALCHPTDSESGRDAYNYRVVIRCGVVAVREGAGVSGRRLRRLVPHHLHYGHGHVDAHSVPGGEPEQAHYGDGVSPGQTRHQLTCRRKMTSANASLERTAFQCPGAKDKCRWVERLHDLLI